jgi:nucleoside-diphosphate-sugar epimerase
MRIEGKVVLTGASGFIGGRLRDRLLADGAEVISIRRKGSPPSKTGRSVELDYEDLPGLEKFFAEEQPRYVLHVAGATKGVSYEDFRKANVMPTENLLKAVSSKHPSLERFTLVSSLAAYGPCAVGQPHTEAATRNPVEFYGKSKLEAEQVLETIGSKVKWTIVRPGGVYGPGDVDYFNLFREVSKGRNVFFGNRDKWQSVIFVDDLIDVILLATVKPEAIGKGYLISDDQHLTWGQFQDQLVELSGRKAMTMNLPAFTVDVAAFFGELMSKFDGKPRLLNRQKAIMGAQAAWLCTSAAAQRDLGFTPKVSLKEGIERTFAWYRENKWL